MSWWICGTCGVEHSERPDTCAICEDERQWVPEDGQHWTTLNELRAAGTAGAITTLEPDLFAVSSTPGVGIGQQSKLVRTSQGMLLWDPLGYVDDDLVSQIAGLGHVIAIASSHPHMFGVQVEWSRALGGVPVLVNEADAEWLARRDPVIETWSGRREILPQVVLLQVGGHFPGSSVVHWTAGADGRGVILAGDSVMANPDRTSVSFMRSYPNRLPLSGNIAQRISAALATCEFDRLYSNFDGRIPASAREIVLISAQRHAAWARGDFDHLT